MVTRPLSKNVEEHVDFSLGASFTKEEQCSVPTNSLSTTLPNSSSKKASTKPKFDLKYRQSTRKTRKSLEDRVQNMKIAHVQRFFESTQKLRDDKFMKQVPTLVSVQQSKQLIYETWLVNTVVSTDCQSEVKMRKRAYLEKFNKVSNNDIIVEKAKSK